MIHSIPALETDDPRLKEIFSYCRPPGMPKYGLGYIEQANTVIPDCRFNNPLSADIQKPSIPEMHKFFTLIKGCKKWQVDKDWMKRMINWDLFSHPDAVEFNASVPAEQKQSLAKEWQSYMNNQDCWISFYEWRKNISEKQLVQMMDFEKGKGIESPNNKWKSIDGQQLESTSTFPPFKSILLEKEEKQCKVVPLVLAKEESQMSNTDRRI